MGEPKTTQKIKIGGINEKFSEITIDGNKYNDLLKDQSVSLNFEGNKSEENWHRKLAEAKIVEVPSDAIALYEATCFAADNNALEVRSLMRSGETKLPKVKAARDAFFDQNRFKERGVWDKYLFDGNDTTSFYVCRRRYKDFRIEGGCLRLDLGKNTELSKLILKYPDVYALQPLEPEEGIYAYASNNLKDWDQISGFIGKDIIVDFPKDKKYRYIKFPRFPDRITELIGLGENGEKLDRSNWKASNLFADYAKTETKMAMSASFKLENIADDAFLCVAINGEHGNEGAYASLKIGGKYVGAPDRSISYPANTWESGVCHKDEATKNYTYYFPLKKWMENKEIEAFVLVNSEAKELKPEIWITNDNQPYEKIVMVIKRK